MQNERDPATAARRLHAMKRCDAERVSAVLSTGSFAEAARSLDCDRDTVSSAWHRYSPDIHAIILAAIHAPPVAAVPHNAECSAQCGKQFAPIL